MVDVSESIDVSDDSDEMKENKSVEYVDGSDSAEDDDKIKHKKKNKDAG